MCSQIIHLSHKLRVGLEMVRWTVDFNKDSAVKMLATLLGLQTVLPFRIWPFTRFHMVSTLKTERIKNDWRGFLLDFKLAEKTKQESFGEMFLLLLQKPILKSIAATVSSFQSGENQRMSRFRPKNILSLHKMKFYWPGIWNVISLEHSETVSLARNISQDLLWA